MQYEVDGFSRMFPGLLVCLQVFLICFYTGLPVMFLILYNKKQFRLFAALKGLSRELNLAFDD
jgi:hypothetical protein